MKKKIEIEIDNLETTAPLYKQYDGQTYPQPAYIEIDPRGDSIQVSADYSSESGNAVPAFVWHGLVYRIPCPEEILGESLITYLKSETFQSQVQELCDGYSADWDGSNHVGSWGQWTHQIAEAIESDLRKLEYVQIYEGDDWIENDIKYFDADGNTCTYYTGAVRAVYGGTIEITRENLFTLVEDAESYAESDTIIVNLEGAFENIIDMLEENKD